MRLHLPAVDHFPRSLFFFIYLSTECAKDQLGFARFSRPSQDFYAKCACHQPDTFTSFCKHLKKKNVYNIMSHALHHLVGSYGNLPRVRACSHSTFVNFNLCAGNSAVKILLPFNFCSFFIHVANDSLEGDFLLCELFWSLC